MSALPAKPSIPNRMVGPAVVLHRHLRLLLSPLLLLLHSFHTLVPTRRRRAGFHARQPPFRHKVGVLSVTDAHDRY